MISKDHFKASSFLYPARNQSFESFFCRQFFCASNLSAETRLLPKPESKSYKFGFIGNLAPDQLGAVSTWCNRLGAHQVGASTWCISSWCNIEIWLYRKFGNSKFSSIGNFINSGSNLQIIQILKRVEYTKISMT